MISPELLKKIKNAILEAEKNGNKSVEIHYQILENAKALSVLSDEDFCREFNLTDGYKIEFKKMLKLANYIEQKKHFNKEKK